MTVTHEYHEHRSPVAVTAICSCGWSHRETRKQNALARQAKIRAAVNRHFAEIESRAHGDSNER